MPTLPMPIWRALVAAAVVSAVAACSTAPSRPAAETPPAPVPASSAVAGTWVLTVQSPMGTRDSDAVFAQSGEQLTGKIIGPRGEVPLSGAVDGEAINFGININVQGQPLQIDYAGTVTGDTMEGTVQFGSFGDGTWTGKRKAQ